MELFYCSLKIFFPIYLLEEFFDGIFTREIRRMVGSKVSIYLLLDYALVLLHSHAKKKDICDD